MADSLIHPTAIVDAPVKLAADVRVGAYTVIKGDVHVGPGTTIGEQCVIHGATRIGSHCTIYPKACLGLDPQHAKFVADPANPTYLIIGDGVSIREAARLNRAFHAGLEHATRIGNRVFIMGGAHVGHDCVVEEDAIIADSALLGGHVHVGSRAFLGGNSVFHQFVRVGRLSIIAGMEGISQDVPPFAAVRYGRLKGYNAVGCRRAGLSRAGITGIRAAFRALAEYRQTTKAVEVLRSQRHEAPEVAEILAFIESSKRGILPTTKPDAGGDRAMPADS